ncbi:MAG: FAD-binding protein [Candidatus Aminicenantes bacterium]|nr:FAD-binding protein [Candidatus Aminicenantes bacterium]
MYPDYMHDSLKKVDETRQKRLELERSGKNVFPPMTAEEREDVLNKFHPDYKPESRRQVHIGPNKGELLTTEVADILESHSRIESKLFDLTTPDYETDILIVGAGGAGCAAAIIARQNGAQSIISTKLRMGDANSMMSQGGMQAAVTEKDSPTIHYLDALGGGHFDNKPDLVRALTEDGPEVVKWLEDLGVVWDKNPDGSMYVLHGGGTSRKRMHSCRDYTGAIIMRTLMDEVRNHPDDIKVLEFMPTVELIMDDKGRCAGGILYNMETEEYFTVKAKAVIIATGGYGRLHIRGFDTTNHYGATGDGLVIAYRAGAKLMYMDSVQYHPTGSVFPEQIAGFLITEKIRGAGGQPINKFGELFVWPREPRDVESASFIRECLERKNGIQTPSGRWGVWLDSPLIEIIQGDGYMNKNFPAMYRQFIRYNIDITKEPMLVYPSLHYQNGGVEINDHCETNVKGLYVAGEASGGVHGRNRLMGNSVLDYNVFGRRAGKFAAGYAKSAPIGKLSLEHITAYENELKKAKIKTDRVAPVLLPLYTSDEVKKRQLTAHYEGTLR